MGQVNRNYYLFLFPTELAIKISQYSQLANFKAAISVNNYF